MGRRTTMAWAVALVLGTAPAGSTMSFPSADQSHVFACHQDSDCASGYMCGAYWKCDVPSEAGGDGGTTGTDGGTTGTDGGTSGTDGEPAAPTAAPAAPTAAPRRSATPGSP